MTTLSMIQLPHRVGLGPRAAPAASGRRAARWAALLLATAALLGLARSAEPAVRMEGAWTRWQIDGVGDAGLHGERHPFTATDLGPAHRVRSRRTGRGPRFFRRRAAPRCAPSTSGRRRALLSLAALPLSTRAQADATLAVASFPDLDRATRALQPEWARRQPALPIRLVTRNYPDHHDAMNAALATRSGLPDVMAMDLRYIGRFAAGGGLLDLRPFAQADGLSLDALPAFSVAQASTPRGALIAMPTDIGPGTLLYRLDLLQKAGLAESDLLSSWQSFLQAGTVIKRTTGAYLLTDAADLRDIVLRAGLRDGEGLYFDANGRPLVNSERFYRAFELSVQARRAGLDLVATPWTNEWAAAYRQGRVASQMMGCWLAGHLKNWLAPAQSGLWRSTTLPGGAVASFGGSFYAIPQGAAHPEAAWAFIRQMVFNPATQLQSLRLIDAFPALRQVHQDAVMDEPLPYLGGQRARLLWRDIAAQVPATPVHKFDSLATRIVRDAFEQVLNQGRPIGAVLREAESLIRRRARR